MLRKASEVNVCFDCFSKAMILLVYAHLSMDMFYLKPLVEGDLRHLAKV
jgi:hypothetical protein